MIETEMGWSAERRRSKTKTEQLLKDSIVSLNIVDISTATDVSVGLEKIAENIENIAVIQEAVNKEAPILIGLQFMEARKAFPSKNESDRTAERHGWVDWIEVNTRYSDRSVREFIQIAENCDHEIPPGAPIRVLSLMSRDTMPPEAKKELTKRLKAGERITSTEATQVKQTYLPSPEDARAQAKETGRFVQASNGRLYTGATKAECDKADKIMTEAYKIKDAIEAVGNCNVSPEEWLSQTNDYYLHDFNYATLDAAIKWLQQLRPALKKVQGVIDA